MAEDPARLDRFVQALSSLDWVDAKAALSEAAVRSSPVSAVESLIVPALELLGKGWEEGTVALSQIYMSGRICEELVDAILPPRSAQRVSQPKMAIAVLDDHHLLGKRLVYSTLRAGGYELADYGRTDAEGLVARVRAERVKIVLISTLMLRSALHIKDVKAGLPADVLVVAGGAPFRFDDQLGTKVGADAVGRTASSALEIVARLTRAAV